MNSVNWQKLAAVVTVISGCLAIIIYVRKLRSGSSS